MIRGTHRECRDRYGLSGTVDAGMLVRTISGLARCGHCGMTFTAPHGVFSFYRGGVEEVWLTEQPGPYMNKEELDDCREAQHRVYRGDYEEELRVTR